MLCHLTSEVHKCVAIVSLYYGTDSSASCRAAPTLESTVLVKHWELNCSGCMRNMFVPHNCIYSKKKCSRNVTNSRFYDTKCVENQGCSILHVYTNNAQQALHSVSASFCWLYTDLMCWSLILAGWDQNGGKSRVNIRLEFLMWSETQTLIWCPLWMCKLDINMSASCSGFYLLPRV